MTAEEARMVQEIKSRCESNTHQINELKERMTKQEERSETLYKMSENIALMAQSFKQMEEDVGEIKESQKDLSQKVSTLENQPAKETVAKMNSVKWSVISAVCGAIGMGIFALIIEQLNK